MEDSYCTEHRQELNRVPEARYAYYRRCQVFRKNGEQCKAPAEKGASICYAHAGQQAMAFRRDLERQIMLAEAVAEIRGQGRPEFEMADLFMDFKSIQVTLAVMARALIVGRIDCKTAGRLLVHLQMASKLLWMVHREGRKGRKESQISPLICADKRGTSKIGNLPEQNMELPTKKSTCSIVRSRAKRRSEQASDQGKALELRIKGAAKSTGNAASTMNMRTRNAKIVAIRSVKQAQNLFSTLQRQDSRPALLTG